MEKIIGKVSATEKNPATIDEFYFWTNSDVLLSPFDVVKVSHLNNSISYGVIEEINHVTDSASHFSSYISSDFGSIKEDEIVNGNTDRVAFNYIRARVIGNNDNVYIPVLHGTPVQLCSVEDIKYALGLDEKNIKNPLRCGYLEMYGEKVPVDINADFIIGPDGAHLNVSGISGLACKTSYSMFLLNSLQQKCMKEKKGKSVAYVFFNVKGQDLLRIDSPVEKLAKEQEDLYKMLELEPKPFKNVHYYYPYSNSKEHHNIQSYGDWNGFVQFQFGHGLASTYKYPFKQCKNKLEYMFSNEDDPSSTLASIITYVNNENKPFGGCKTWKQFQDAINEVFDDASSPARKEIVLSSWKKFSRILHKVISDNLFNDAMDEEKSEVYLSDEIRSIKPNEVKVVDLARLDPSTQAFVFGDIIETINDMMSGKVSDELPDKIVIFVDELNKYASKDTPKDSPILKQLLEIAERGRSLGAILFSVEQFRSAIHDRVKGNCSTSAYGRTNFVEVGKDDYKYLGNTYRTMMTRLSPGDYIISNPALRSLIKIKFPRPTYKQD